MIKSQIDESVARVGKWHFSAEYGIIASPKGKKLLLEPRLSRLIYFLSLNANTHVSRNYLFEHIWLDTIVNEESLTRAVADLRKILALHFKETITIETLRKRGYKLSLKEDKFGWSVHPRISNAILGAILFVILIWFLADLFGLVQTKIVNANS
ncbi:MAG: winged helix-turn-helix domain-containing protein [Bacteroidota bacterium]